MHDGCHEVTPDMTCLTFIKQTAKNDGRTYKCEQLVQLAYYELQLHECILVIYEWLSVPDIKIEKSQNFKKLGCFILEIIQAEEKVKAFLQSDGLTILCTEYRTTIKKTCKVRKSFQ